MQISSTSHTIAATTAPTAQSADDASVGQARFRIEGSGPLSGRSIVPASAAAKRLLERDPRRVVQSLRGVLELVEHAAGGARASESVRINGIALAATTAAHGANTVQAHVDDDPKLGASLDRLDPQQRQTALDTWVNDEMRSAAETEANVVSGWLNVGPDVSAAMVAPAPRQDTQLGQMVRVLRHEAQHLADGNDPLLSPRAALALREASAEAHSNSLPQLQSARRMLGLDTVVTDSALCNALTQRPYLGVEQVVASALRSTGIDPRSTAASTLLALPADQLGEALVTRLVAATPGSTDAAARAALAEELERALDATGA